MKKFFNIVAAVLAGSILAISMTACDGGNKGNGGNGGDSYITVDPTSVSFAAEGGTETVDVTSSSEWNIAEADQWIETEKTLNTITVTVGSTEAERKGTIKLTNADGREALVVVDQEALVVNDITVDPDTITFDKDGSTQTVKVTSNVDWDITEADSWIDAVKEGSSLSVTVRATDVWREGTITLVNADKQEATVNVIQTTPGITVDDMVGIWTVTGLGIYQDISFTDYRHIAISRVDDFTIQIKDMLGISEHKFPGVYSTDIFQATIKNNTISIAAQPMTPTFDQDGWPVYLCRGLNDASVEGVGFEANWMVGFENIPIKSDMTIDLGEGGWHIYDLPTSGMAMYTTFIPLSKDPSGRQPGAFWYDWYYLNTKWTKGEEAEPPYAPEELSRLGELITPQLSDRF